MFRAPYNRSHSNLGGNEDRLEDHVRPCVFYTALYGLIDRIWRLTDSDDMATLLGEMGLRRDGTSAEPDIMARWRSYGTIDSEQAGYECAIKFLDRQVELTHSKDLASLVKHLRSHRGKDRNQSLLRKAWLHQIDLTRSGLLSAAFEFRVPSP